MSASVRFPPIIELRKTVAALFRKGYPLAARSILSGITRVIRIHDDDDWNLFQYEMGLHQRSAWFGDDMDAFLDDEELQCIVVSYRHVDWRTRTPRGATMSSAQWARLRAELRVWSKTGKVNRFVLWIDQILHCSKSLSAGVNWVTKGVLPYIALPVVYVGGPEESECADDACRRRLWPAIERAAAVTSGGITLRGTMARREVMLGGNVGLAPSLFWLAARIVGGTFNGCELSWTQDYISFRDMSLRILRSESPLDCMESFLRASAERTHTQHEIMTTMEAFRLSRDSNRLLSSGRRHIFFGTYLAARVESAQTDSGEWHGVREWVQYKWDDGLLRNESADERLGVLGNTHWALFVDGRNRRCVYGVGVVSESGEIQAMGVVHLKGVSKDGHGTILWFQRGLSSHGNSFARHIANCLQPTQGLIDDVAKHWSISLGAPIALVKAVNMQWKWNTVVIECGSDYMTLLRHREGEEADGK